MSNFGFKEEKWFSAVLGIVSYTHSVQTQSDT